YELLADEEEVDKLAWSLAPKIFGHEALLHLLVGAPHRKLKDGMKIRGDLHICLMDYPGKLQKVTYTHVAPGGVYTTGRGSSRVGLTAVVQKDPVTNEILSMVTQGQLSIKCKSLIPWLESPIYKIVYSSLDTSLYLEQTVSIAIAGITTSLISRTPVLAALNLKNLGSYDLRRTPAENVNFPPALLSRFDLLGLILDRADMDTDLELARLIVYVHQNKESPALGWVYSPRTICTPGLYICCKKSISQCLEEYIATAYSSIRQP
ncbi:DNA replication licensing factor MCM7, partial [Striga asiatica]